MTLHLHQPKKYFKEKTDLVYHEKRKHTMHRNTQISNHKKLVLTTKVIRKNNVVTYQVKTELIEPHLLNFLLKIVE